MKKYVVLNMDNYNEGAGYSLSSNFVPSHENTSTVMQIEFALPDWCSGNNDWLLDVKQNFATGDINLFLVDYRGEAEKKSKIDYTVVKE